MSYKSGNTDSDTCMKYWIFTSSCWGCEYRWTSLGNTIKGYKVRVKKKKKKEPDVVPGIADHRG